MREIASSTVFLLSFFTTISDGFDLGGLFGGSEQAAGVRGILMCDGRPASNVKVKLWDDDRGIDMDDLLDSGKTDAQGHFELKGYTSEITTIDPKLNIYHDCNDGIRPCQRKFNIEIPDTYVSEGKIPQKIYNIGTMELSGKMSGETRDCLNRM